MGSGGAIVRRFERACDPKRNGYRKRRCDEFVAGLTALDKARIRVHLAVDRVRLIRKRRSPRQLTAQAQCFRSPDDIMLRAENRRGDTLWEFSQSITWCGDGNRKITSHGQPRISGKTFTWFWTYDGIDSDSSFDEVFQGDFIEYYEAYAVGRFKGCVTGPQVGLLCDNQYPWLDAIGTPNGGYSANAG